MASEWPDRRTTGHPVAAVLKLPETERRFAAQSAEVDIRTPAEIRKMIPVDLVKWAKVAKDAGMQKQ